MLRLFISVDLPEEIASEVEDVQSNLYGSDADLNFVDPDQAHITMKFLGDTQESRVGEVKDILDEVAASHSSFRADVKGTGVFPNRDYISVIWAGIQDGSEELSRIHEDLEELVVDQDLADEEKHDFTPHITLARMNSGRGKNEVHDFLDETTNEELGSFEVTELRLKKSTLKSDGPVYETLHKAPL